jgi:hypothetical protein
LIYSVIAIILVACGQQSDSKEAQTQQKKEEGVGHTQDVVRDTKMEAETIGVKGDVMKAFLAAYQDFLDDKGIPDKMKQLQNYDLGLRDTKDYYEISFIPSRKEGSRPQIGGASDVGQMMSYKINKGQYSIKEKLKYQ